MLPVPSMKLCFGGIVVCNMILSCTIAIRPWDKEQLIRFWSDLHFDLDSGILFLCTV